MKKREGSGRTKKVEENAFWVREEGVVREREVREQTIGNGVPSSWQPCILIVLSFRRKGIDGTLSYHSCGIDIKVRCPRLLAAI